MGPARTARVQLRLSTIKVMDTPRHQWLVTLGRRTGPVAAGKPESNSFIGPDWHLECPQTPAHLPPRLVLPCPVYRAHRILAQWAVNQAPGRRCSCVPIVTCILSRANWYHALITRPVIRRARRNCYFAASSVECVAVVRRCRNVASGFETSTMAWLFARLYSNPSRHLSRSFWSCMCASEASPYDQQFRCGYMLHEISAAMLGPCLSNLWRFCSRFRADHLILLGMSGLLVGSGGSDLLTAWCGAVRHGWTQAPSRW